MPKYRHKSSKEVGQQVTIANRIKPPKEERHSRAAERSPGDSVSKERNTSMRPCRPRSQVRSEILGPNRRARGNPSEGPKEAMSVAIGCPSRRTGASHIERPLNAPARSCRDAQAIGSRPASKRTTRSDSSRLIRGHQEKKNAISRR